MNTKILNRIMRIILCLFLYVSTLPLLVLWGFCCMFWDLGLKTLYFYAVNGRHMTDHERIEADRELNRVLFRNLGFYKNWLLPDEKDNV